MADYFAKKYENRRHAEEHTARVAERYVDEIAGCIRRSSVYGPGSLSGAVSPTGECFRSVQAVLPLDSVSAVFQMRNDHPGSRIAVLNFASYKAPGGLFMSGSSAQEESLCHESFLYNVLSAGTNFYEWNKKHLNRHLYLDRAVYSPDIRFFRSGNSVLCDVISCAAPNHTAASKYAGVTPDENLAAMRQRISFVRDIAVKQQVDVLVAGAYGCGVFGQDPEAVASMFTEAFSSVSRMMQVIYAVPAGVDPGNLLAFCRVLKRKG